MEGGGCLYFPFQEQGSLSDSKVLQQQKHRPPTALQPVIQVAQGLRGLGPTV